MGSLWARHALLIRFLCVGVINTAFGYGCFALLLWIGMHYAPALLLATIAGVLFNFKSIGILVFRSHDNRLIVRFVLSYCVVYVVNVSGVRLFMLAGIAPAVGGALLLLPMALLAYLLNKRFVFHHVKAH
ncbi:hypothetical protein PAN31117_04851 [Pandoraea anapnoica]|uniref:GtrA/DPMS transmembrane domain-containing protein n=1 Tax=Pandoraea anapnoica TaxID=2508301 RepID=A0A5E5AKA9_9BURK|nr:GtrA family protein [Pandoraea anapnoica]VVE74119.1 hypothetical protein PAN31117_04851 [Pandoraea anapnoica]